MSRSGRQSDVRVPLEIQHKLEYRERLRDDARLAVYYVCRTVSLAAFECTFTVLSFGRLLPKLLQFGEPKTSSIRIFETAVGFADRNHCIVSMGWNDLSICCPSHTIAINVGTTSFGPNANSALAFAYRLGFL